MRHPTHVYINRPKLNGFKYTRPAEILVYHADGSFIVREGVNSRMSFCASFVKKYSEHFKFCYRKEIDLELLQRARDMVEHLKTLDRWVPCDNKRPSELNGETVVTVKHDVHGETMVYYKALRVKDFCWDTINHYKIKKEKK